MAKSSVPKAMRRIGLILYFFMIINLAVASVPTRSPNSQQKSVILSAKNAFEVPDHIKLSHLRIDFLDKATAARSNALLKMLLDPDIPTNIVHEIKVTGIQSVGNWTLLTELFERSTEIQDVYWEAEKAIPSKILAALHQRHPLRRLHYTASFIYWDLYDEDGSLTKPVGQANNHESRARARESIIGSKVLHSLKAPVEYRGAPNLDDLDFVFRILGSCPNLRDLDLSVNWEGCVVSGGTPYAFDFMSHTDIKFPPLESLTLGGYRLDEQSDGGVDWYYKEEGPWKERLRWPWSVLPEWVVDWIGYYDIAYSFSGVKPMEYTPRRDWDEKTSLDCWLEVMDWSHLRTLNLGWPNSGSEPIMEKLGATDLPSLKNLTLINGDFRSEKAVFGFLASTTRPLEAISLQSMNFDALEGIVHMICKHHSTELRSLSIHQSEREWETGNNAILTLNGTGLSTLIECLTKLEHLQIDVNRTEPWNSSIYSVLASSPSLSSLEIHFPSPDLGIDDLNHLVRYREHNGIEDEIDPIVNQTSVQGLYRDLREMKVGETLETLEVVVGKWESRYDSGGMMERERRRTARYSCLIDEDGKEVCEGMQLRNVDW